MDTFVVPNSRNYYIYGYGYLKGKFVEIVVL